MSAAFFDSKSTLEPCHLRSIFKKMKGFIYSFHNARALHQRRFSWVVAYKKRLLSPCELIYSSAWCNVNQFEWRYWWLYCRSRSLKSRVLKDDCQKGVKDTFGYKKLPIVFGVGLFLFSPIFLWSLMWILGLQKIDVCCFINFCHIDI